MKIAQASIYYADNKPRTATIETTEGFKMYWYKSDGKICCHKHMSFDCECIDLAKRTIKEIFQ